MQKKHRVHGNAGARSALGAFLPKGKVKDRQGVLHCMGGIRNWTKQNGRGTGRRTSRA